MLKRILFTFALSTSLLFQAHAADLPNVTILATGGTIAGSASTSTNLTDYKAGSLTAQQLIDAVPALVDIANVNAEQIANVGSNNLKFSDWLTLAKRINTLLASDDCDGIVVTHGTDTTEETAYFLNLVVKSEKPVVVVGAMLPATAISADGPLNLLNAVGVAGSKDSIGKGVMIVLNGQIVSGREGTKTNTLAKETFKVHDLGMLGYVINFKPVFYRELTRLHTKDTEFDVSELDTLPRVDILYQYLEVSADMYQAVVDSKPAGIITAGTGNGSLFDPTRAVLKEAAEDGIVVVRSSRVGSGVITPSAKDAEYGFLTSDNLNPQKARILLTLALTKTNDIEEIREMFAKY